MPNSTTGSATEDHQGFPEGPIQDGLTPEQDSSGSAEGSLYGTLGTIIIFHGLVILSQFI